MKYDLVRWSKIIGKTELQQYQIVGVDEADISKGKSRLFRQLPEY
jgi:transcription elongation GreA/GreB family factor